MTTKEKIAVMQGYLDGKTIQYKRWDEEKWFDFDTYDGCPESEIVWDWGSLDYRIKPEAKVRPYTFDEMCNAVKKHGLVVKNKSVKTCWTITSFTENIITFNASYGDITTYKELLESLVWFDDNSPCGIVEE